MVDGHCLIMLIISLRDFHNQTRSLMISCKLCSVNFMRCQNIVQLLLIVPQNYFLVALENVFLADSLCLRNNNRLWNQWQLKVLLINFFHFGKEIFWGNTDPPWVSLGCAWHLFYLEFKRLDSVHHRIFLLNI